MLTNMEEEQKKKLPKIRKHRSISKQNKLTRSPSPISRQKHQSSTRKRTSILSKEERKYQHFVNDLNRDIHIYLNRCLRESHFDSRGNIIQSIDEMKERKRLSADVHKILSGPALKTFYTQYVQSRHSPTSNSKLYLHPLEESILWSNEQE